MQGVGHFARVVVDATILQSGVIAFDEIAESDGKNGEHIQCNYADWVDAAIEGARCCAEALVEQQKIMGARVVVLRVMGTECDTNPNTVWCAAALATWQALNPDEPLPAFERVEGKLVIPALN